MLPRCLVVPSLLLASLGPAANVLQVGRNLAVPAGQQRHNVSCLLCSTEVSGHATGSVRVFAGNVFLNGLVVGNVVVFGGNVTLNRTAVVGGQVLVIGGHLQQDSAAASSGHTVLHPVIFLPAILLVCVLIGALIRLTRRSVQGPVIYPPLPRL